MSDSTAREAVLLTCTGDETATRLGLWHRDGKHHDVDVPAGRICALTAHREGSGS